MQSLRRAAAVVVVFAAVAGCRDGAPRPAAVTTPSPSAPSVAVVAPSTPVPAPTKSRASTHVAAPALARAPRFAWHSAPVTAAALGRSWHPGCPVGPSRLRAVTVTFWGFDARPHTGTLVVAAASVPAVAEAFRRIYAARFPIRRIVPISAYGGSDDASMAADNTSAFNCRYAVANGPKTWSMHAYGEAVDIDTLENPYTLDGRVYPPAGKPYTNRSRVRPGMIVPGSAPVRAFTSVGWGWGGRWGSSPDYQHFSANGK